MDAVRFNFDEFVVDTAAREVRRSGSAVHLSPKAFDLLQALLEQRPAAISKPHLHALLWPKTFVTDTSLATLVGDVRSALGDEARRPRYIRTVHAYGYAFCGEALCAPDPAGLAAPSCWLTWDGRTVPLIEGENIVGRAAGSSVVIDSAEVSRRHARITVAHGTATIEDLSSRNGTFVGHARIAAPRQLTDGEVIGIGPLSLTFHAALRDATTRAVAPARTGQARAGRPKANV